MGLFLNFVQVALGILAISFAYIAYIPYRNNISQENFKDLRNEVRVKHNKLINEVFKEFYDKDTKIPLLSHSESSKPISLKCVNVEVENTKNVAKFEDTKIKKLLPYKYKNRKYSSYSEAIESLNENSYFENRTSYSIIELVREQDKASMKFNYSKYFDYFNYGEILGLEYLKYKNKPHKMILRNEIKDKPFDFNNRIANPGVVTITLIYDKDKNKMNLILLRRSKNLAIYPNQLCAIPSGELQPTSEDIYTRINNNECKKDRVNILLSNILREFSEEVLNFKEYFSPIDTSDDFDNPEMKKLLDLYEGDYLKVYYLDTIIQPLTFKPEILTVLVIEKEAFESLYKESKKLNKHSNQEGEILGIRFDGNKLEYNMELNEEVIGDLTNREDVVYSTAKCLEICKNNKSIIFEGTNLGI